MATAVADGNMDMSQYKHSRHELSYSKLDEFRKSDIAWDVTLKSADGKEIHAHKCVLASQSEYFESMFIGGFKETTQDVIQINDISSNVLKNVIDFMYTGELVTIDKDNVEEMLNAADMFQMDDIQNECIKYYVHVVNDHNCLEFKETADLRAMTTLSEICLNYALHRFLHIAEHQSFLEVDVTHLMQLLKSNDLRVANEEPVYRAMMKWVKYDETKRKHLLPDLLANVRLVYTSEDFLVEEVLEDPLINSNPECREIVKKVIVHFSYKYGDSLSKIITNTSPRIETNKLTMDEMRRLRHYDCSDSPDYSDRGPIDLLDYFKVLDLNHHFPEVEWNQYMNEDNFLTSFSEEWRGINEGTTDDDDDEEESVGYCTVNDEYENTKYNTLAILHYLCKHFFIAENLKMLLRYYRGEDGTRVYTLKKMDPSGNQTLSAHPARFTPTDQHSKERIRIKERFGLLPTQKPAPEY